MYSTAPADWTTCKSSILKSMYVHLRYRNQVNSFLIVGHSQEFSKFLFTQSAGTVEYTDCTSAEG